MGARAGRGRVEAAIAHAGPAEGAAGRRGHQRYRRAHYALRGYGRKRGHHQRGHHVAHAAGAQANAGGGHRVADDVLPRPHGRGHEAVAAARGRLHARASPHAARRAAGQRHGAIVEAQVAARAGIGL